MNQLRGVIEIWGRYWSMYGGARAFFGSPYLHIAILLSIPTYGVWHSNDWWNIVISTLPNLIGFSLAGLAIFLSFGDEAFKRALSELRTADEISPFLMMVTTFVHYIVMQSVAFIYAIVALSASKLHAPDDPCFRSWVDILTPFASWFGFTLFLYAILLTLAATFTVLRLSQMFDLFQTPPTKNDHEQP